MIALTIKSKNNNVYEFCSEYVVSLSLKIYFDGIQSPDVGDKILIHKDLINSTSEIFSQPYVFEYTTNISATEIKKNNSTEHIVVKHNGKYYCLKRIYG